MPMDIHITRKGEQHGPYPEANAREMLAAGQLLPTDLAWHAGADGWKPLGEVLGAATQPPATPPPSPPPAGGGTPKRTVAGTAPAEEKPAEEKPEESEPDDPDKILVTRKGEPIGPYSREKAKEYFASGQLLPTDWGWHDGMDDWKPINEVLGMAAPAQTAAAGGRPGKGKKVAMIAGIVVLVSGLIFAGITYGPGLMAKISGGGKIDTPEELAKRAVKAFAKKDFEAFEKLTPLPWTKGEWEKAFEETLGGMTDESLEKLAKIKGVSLSEMKEELKKKIEEELEEEMEDIPEEREKLRKAFEEVLKDAEADGVVWSEVEFVSADTSEIDAMKGPAGSPSKGKKGDIDITISCKGKNYVLRLDDCVFLPSPGWFTPDEPRWKGD
jgi:hypothetical protein